MACIPDVDIPLQCARLISLPQAPRRAGRARRSPPAARAPPRPRARSRCAAALSAAAAQAPARHRANGLIQTHASARQLLWLPSMWCRSPHQQ